MNCKNCGTQLIGNEVSCPICGTSLDQSNNVISANTIQNSNVQTSENVQQNNGTSVSATVNNVAAPEVSQQVPQPAGPIMIDPEAVANATLNKKVENNASTNQFNVTTVPTTQVAANNVQQVQSNNNQNVTTPEDNKNKLNSDIKFDRKLLIIIISILIIIGIGIILFFVISGGNNSTVEDTNTNANTEKQKEEKPVTDNTVEYAGYELSIDKSYASQVGDNGLEISSYDTVFYVMVDYTNSYETYKTTLGQQFADQASTMIKTIDKKEYIVVSYNNNGENGIYYTTSLDDATIVGAVVRIGGVAPTDDDINALKKIIDTAKFTGIVDNIKGTNLDAGANGLKIFGPLSSAAKFLEE